MKSQRQLRISALIAGIVVFAILIIVVMIAMIGSDTPKFQEVQRSGTGSQRSKLYQLFVSASPHNSKIYIGGVLTGERIVALSDLERFTSEHTLASITIEQEVLVTTVKVPARGYEDFKKEIRIAAGGVEVLQAVLSRPTPTTVTPKKKGTPKKKTQKAKELAEVDRPSPEKGISVSRKGLYWVGIVAVAAFIFLLILSINHVAPTLTAICWVLLIGITASACLYFIRPVAYLDWISIILFITLNFALITGYRHVKCGAPSYESPPALAFYKFFLFVIWFPCTFYFILSSIAWRALEAPLGYFSWAFFIPVYIFGLILTALVRYDGFSSYGFIVILFLLVLRVLSEGPFEPTSTFDRSDRTISFSEIEIREDFTLPPKAVKIYSSNVSIKKSGRLYSYVPIWTGEVYAVMSEGGIRPNVVLEYYFKSRKLGKPPPQVSWDAERHVFAYETVRKLKDYPSSRAPYGGPVVSIQNSVGRTFKYVPAMRPGKRVILLEALRSGFLAAKYNLPEDTGFTGAFYRVVWFGIDIHNSTKGYTRLTVYHLPGSRETYETR